MADSISSATAQPLPPQTTPQRQPEANSEPQQQKTEATQENRQTEQRPPSPDERVGTKVDTQA